MVSDRNTVRKSIWLAWVLLSVGLIATIVATIDVKMDVEADAKREFDFACIQIQLRIDARMDAHEQILTSAAALFDASDEVTREEWHAYTQRQKVEQHLPGIQGVGFSLMIPHEQLEQHIQEIRSRGFPDYNVKPEGDREIYTSIIYLEPFSGRNLRAFGYDMFSEPVRRMAMERAMDLNVAALSGKVILAQETDQEVQAGTLMYVPVYRKGMSTETVADRRAALYGWVYSPYRMNDLMQGILKGWDLEAKKLIRLQIFDTGQLSADSLLYDSQPKGEMETVNTSRLTLQTHAVFSDHFWSLQFTRTDGQLEYGRVYGVFFGGTIISLLLFGLLISLLNTRFRARQLADQLTVDLRESEEKFRNFADHSLVGIYLIQDGIFKYVNPKFSEIFGYTVAQCLDNMNFNELVYPEDMHTVEGNLHKRLSGEVKKSHYVFRGIRKNSEIVYIEIFGFSTLFNGKPSASGTLLDITERKQAEEVKLENQMRLTDIIEFLPDATLAIDKEKRVIIWNKAIEKMTGVPAAEMIGKGDYAYTIPFYGEARPLLMDLIFMDSGEVAARYPNVAYEDDSLTVEVFCTALYSNKGAWVFAKVSPLHDHSGNVVGAIESIRDITERKRDEEALRKSEAQMRAITDSAQDAILMMDQNGRISYWNPAAESIFGYTCDEAIGKNLHQLIAPQRYHEAHHAAFARFQRTGQGNVIDSTLELKACHKNGHEISVELSLSSLHLQDCWHSVGIIRDITERKQAEEVKAKLEGQIQRAQKMESIGSLAGGIAHDLNNILFPISGLSEMLLDDIPPDTPEHKSIEQIYKSAKRGSDLVKQILSFSRQSNPQKLPIRIQPILKEALKLAQATIPRNIEIKSHINTDCGMISADPTQIHQIVMNLITNAFHAVEQHGGMIDITLKEIAIISFDEKGDLPFHAIPGDILAGGYACITVSDTGTGIDQTLIDKIFDPFFTTKELGKGTGLGLSVVHGIVKEHGGDIRVYSEIGKGTVFHVYLPLLEDTGDIKNAAVIKQYPTGCERILLVDDEEPILHMEQMMLEKLGYKVTVRLSSLDALGAFKANPGNFDLVISDRGMPNMTGEQLAGELMSIRPGIPIILCTGFSNENDVKRAKAMGVKGFLMKPVATAIPGGILKWRNS